MNVTQAIVNITADTGSTFAQEIQVFRTEIRIAKDQAKKATKARGILEACLREIHTIDPAHKSAIECAWVALQRLDEE